MSTRPIYLNNAATSWPKPDQVIDRMVWAMKELGASPSRSGASGLDSEREIFSAREEIAGLIGAPDSSRVIFTINATAALNLAINGLLGPGEAVVTTSMDHNSVARPLARAEDRLGVKVVRVQADSEGGVDPARILEEAAGSRLIVLTHASNVTGTIQPVEQVCAGVRGMGDNRPLVLVDAAQSAGVLPVDVLRTGIDLLAVPGHKGLYGPQGTGFLYIAPGIDLDPLMEGGTGGQSTLPRQPEELPDRYESGTPNLPGIVGLAEAVRFIGARGIGNIHRHETALMDRLLAGLAAVPGLVIHGPTEPAMRVAVLSFNLEGMDPAEVGSYLEMKGIQVRVGLHCSPWAHRTIGTYPEGSVRVSPGLFNTAEDIQALVDEIAALQRLRGRG